MINRKVIFILILLVFMISCTEEYQVDFSDASPKLVVECSLLDIDTTHFVRLSLSKSSFAHNEFDTTFWGLVNKFEPVSDAVVIISDDLGNIDSLKGKPDSLLMYENDYSLSKGYYFTNSIVVQAGNTYFLKIVWNNETYESSCFAPFVPEIDSITYGYVIGESGKYNYYIPYIWFADNKSTADYYLFKTNLGSNVWSRAILSDEFISGKIMGIDVFKGEAIDYWRNAYPPVGLGITYRIEMHSITKETYEYYKALIAQIRNDGGVYTPTPSSPPTNISNGALGYFRASCVQVAEDIIPDPPSLKSELP